MHNSSIGAKNKYVFCKYMYHLFLLFFHTNEVDNGFIHKNTWSPVELHKLLNCDPIV
jgi:hypothetical protein